MSKRVPVDQYPEQWAVFSLDESVGTPGEILCVRDSDKSDPEERFKDLICTMIEAMGEIESG